MFKNSIKNHGGKFRGCEFRGGYFLQRYGKKVHSAKFRGRYFLGCEIIGGYFSPERLT